MPYCVIESVSSQNKNGCELHYCCYWLTKDWNESPWQLSKQQWQEISSRRTRKSLWGVTPGEARSGRPTLSSIPRISSPQLPSSSLQFTSSSILFGTASAKQEEGRQRLFTSKGSNSEEICLTQSLNQSSPLKGQVLHKGLSALEWNVLWKMR